MEYHPAQTKGVFFTFTWVFFTFFFSLLFPFPLPPAGIPFQVSLVLALAVNAALIGVIYSITSYQSSCASLGSAGQSVAHVAPGAPEKGSCLAQQLQRAEETYKVLYWVARYCIVNRH